MLKVNNIMTSGWEAAFRGMRNPLNSWKKADSQMTEDGFIVGENDTKLSKALTKCGSADRKFLRMIHVSMDIDAPLYWWKEMDQYKIATTTDSCSTMHKIHSKALTMDDFSTEHLSEESLEVMQKVIDTFNKNRHAFKDTNDKQYWWQMIQLLPSSFNQMRTWDGNYETLLSMYFARRHHKLDEWHTLCDAIIELPYMKELVEVFEKEESTN